MNYIPFDKSVASHEKARLVKYKKYWFTPLINTQGLNLIFSLVLGFIKLTSFISNL